MNTLSRREFMELSGRLAALFGLGSMATPRLAGALEDLANGTTPVLWLQAQSCSGCSVSFLNSGAPTPAEVLTQIISLKFHSTLSTATGEVAMEIVHTSIEKGGYLLVVEGSLPKGMPRACLLGEEPVTELIKKAAAKAKAVVAIGTCASFGGIPAAEGNPTNAVSLPQFLKEENITAPTICLPGCPCHPDWLVGTLAHVLRFGLPEMDSLGRPKAFYGQLIHDQCPRFADYERERFAAVFGEPGCLFQLGCMGPKTHADCTLRQWNSCTNTCIRANAPCIGCCGELFAAKAAFPFYTKDMAAAAAKESAQ